MKAEVFERAEPDALSRYKDALDISNKLAQGAKDAQTFATTKDLEAKKQRLKLLKMLAGSTTDPRIIKAIAREVAEIARSLGNAAAGSGGGMVQVTANPSASSGDAAGGVAATAPVTTAQAAEGATEGNTSPAELSPQTVSVASPATNEGDDSIKDQVRELLQLAKKILEKLRTLVIPGSRESEEIEKANREVLKAASAFGISLDGSSESSPQQSSAVGDDTLSSSVSASLTVVEVSTVTSVNIEV
ncbi:hypothetical protein [Magnetospirillum molischianum]|uniref:hypothetical protein n=1 Tax=Magnetospirillum molischianum TaxID=1083 RepID=UPI0002E86054|nr:hypothetical protein [Magnetospirillum molischianum]